MIRTATKTFIAMLIGCSSYGQMALDFDGADDNATSPAILNKTDNFTFEVFTQYRTGSDFYKTIMGFGNDVEIKGTGDKIAYVVNNSAGSLKTPYTLTDGQWYHFALVRRNSVWEFYIDGVYYEPNQMGEPKTGKSFWMGGRNASESWNGKMDEVRVWTVARTQTEIQEYMGQCLKGDENDLFLYYQMEGCPGSTKVIDRTGNGYDASLNSMDANTDWVISEESGCAPCVINNKDFMAEAQTFCDQGSTNIKSSVSQKGARYYLRDNSDNSIITGPIFGDGGAVSLNTGTISESKTYNVWAERGFKGIGGLDFDGDNDNATSQAILNKTDNFTFEVYTQYRTGPDFYKTIMGFGNDVEIKGTGDKIAYVVNNSGGSLKTPYTLTDGQWYHFALVRRNSVWEFYIDGVYYEPNQMGEPKTGKSFWMGGRNASESWNGVLDEVRVWTSARTQTEIQENIGKCLKGDEADLFLYYNMDDATGSTIAKDISTGGHDATLGSMDANTDWVNTSSTECEYCEMEMEKTVALTIKKSSAGTDTQVACDTYTWIDGKTYTESNNIATHTLTNSVGCDSVVTLNLTIKKSTMGTDTQVACDAYTWIDGKTYTQSNNTATHTLTNAAGCDSVVTLNLTIKKSTMGTDNQVACDAYTWIDGKTYTENNNTATHTLTNAAGCDSVVTLNLTMKKSTMGTDTQVACDAYTWIDGKTYTESNNTATHTLTNAAGCDSVVTLNLTIKKSTMGTDNQVACDAYTWIDGKTYTESNNTATHTLTNAAGCDSVVTLNLTIKKSTMGTDTQVACDAYTWIDGKTYTESNNTATHTLTNSVGCDSVVTLNLTINSINTDVNVDELTLTASNSGGTYQWINCSNGYAVLANANFQSYTAVSNGDYAVEIKENGCVDTSKCFSITSVGIEEKIMFNTVKLYPNPTKGDLTIDFGGLKNPTINIYSIQGKLVYNQNNVDAGKLNLYFKTEPGLYFVEVISDNKKQKYKLIVN